MFSIIVVFAFLAFSCKSGSSADPYSIGYLSIDYSSIAPVYEVDFGSDDELEINLSGTFSGQDMFLVKMNSNDSVIDSEGAGYVKSENVGRSLMLADTKTVPDLQRTLPVKKDHIASMEFLNLYHPEEESGIFVPSRSIVPEREESIEYGREYNEGETELFWVEDETGDFIEITATLKVQGEYSNIWVPAANFDDGSGSTTDNKLTSAQLTSLSDIFDGTSVAGFDDGIYELVTNVFGYEYGGGSGGDGGKDGDMHVNILIYDIGYDYSPSQNGGFFGYFWGKDYSNDTTTQNWYPSLRSNEAEIFYIDSHFLDKYPNDIYSTLAHEFQHMIHFNRKFIEKGLGNSDTWYNEMLSMLVEDIMQDKLGLDDSASPKSRTRDFVDGYYLSGLTDWLSGNDVYYSYAGSFIFGAFLTRNFGGAKLIKEMIDSDSVNQQSVTDALIAMGYSTETFDSVFDKYSTALIYSTEDLANDILVTNTPLPDPVPVTINSIDYYQTAFDIYDYNNSYTGDPGPVLFFADYKLALRPMGMSIHSDNQWLVLNGTETLDFNIVAPSPGVKYYLMFR